ncbi:hypothetical protein PV326_012923, partial [Microctonus aethiopoides]
MITEMCLELEIALMEPDKNIEILIEVVVLAKNGTVNSGLFSPDVFMNSINFIRDKNGNDRMSIPICNGNYFEYLEVSEVITIIEYRLVYILKIPILVLTHDACVSKVVNIPEKLKEDDYNIKMVSVRHTNWIQFKSNDKCTVAPEIIKIICSSNNKVEEISIEGTKILWVSPRCTVVSDDVPFHLYHDTVINNNAFIPLTKNNFSENFKIFNDPNLNLSFKKIHNIETPDVKIGDLTKFGTNLHEIVREATEIGKHERTKT